MAVGRIGGDAISAVSVVALLPDGTLDGSFGSGGIVATMIEDDYSYGVDVAIDASGRIVVAGVQCSDCGLLTATTQVIVARYNPRWAARSVILRGRD